jgi:hypothetical protein
MILHKKWGEVVRIGNFLFKYASLLGFSKKYNTELFLPNHYMFDYFKHKPNFDNGIEFDLEIQERILSYDEDHWNQYSKDFVNKKVNFSLGSFLQSAKYWEDNFLYVAKMMEFDNALINKVKETYKIPLSKKTIGISIRRGHFINHNQYYQLNEEFFLYSLDKYFPDWEDYNLIFFSDDYNWIRETFKGDTVYYSDGNFVNQDYHNNPMEQLMYGSLCDNFIISNSTFSWWLAYLSTNIKNNGGKVVHSGKNIRGYLESNANPLDYYHTNWVISDFFEKSNIDINTLTTRKIYAK